LQNEQYEFSEIAMIGNLFLPVYRSLVSLFKKADKSTGYKIGNIIRFITNINTRKYWDKKSTSYGRSWRDFPYRYLLEFLPNNSRFSLLDIGCALGDGCLLLKNNFPRAEISGADFSSVAIERARKKTNQINFFVLDILKESPPKKYNYITLISTLEHFNEPYPIVDKCLNYVEKAVLIEIPYTERFDNPHLYWRGQHRFLFNEKTFIGYNFKILKITELVKSTGYQYILYELKPNEDK
jgi:SAM-dependent methyltransferase